MVITYDFNQTNPDRTNGNVEITTVHDGSKVTISTIGPTHPEDSYDPTNKVRSESNVWNQTAISQADLFYSLELYIDSNFHILHGGNPTFNDIRLIQLHEGHSAGWSGGILIRPSAPDQLAVDFRHLDWNTDEYVHKKLGQQPFTKNKWIKIILHANNNIFECWIDGKYYYT